MPDVLKAPADPRVERLRVFLDRAIEGITLEALTIPIDPENVASLAHIGNTLAGLQTLRNLLPR